jgi:hypothetical protein
MQWLAGAFEKKNPRTVSTLHRINNLNSRFDSNWINANQLLKGFANIVAKKNK